MRRVATVVLLCSVILAVAMNCGSSIPKPTPLAKSFPSNPEGEQLYSRYCALCHGENGEGYLADEAPALASQDFLSVAEDLFISENTMRGRPGTPMSAWGVEFGGALTDDDMSFVISHMRTWQKEAPIDLDGVAIEGNAGRGSTPYAILCETCHGREGQGGTALTLNNPVFLETASDGFIEYTIKQGRRQTKMEAFGGELRRREINDLVAFVRELPRAPTFKELVEQSTAAGPREPVEKFVLNQGNPAAEFTLKDGRFIPADDIYAAIKAEQSLLIIDARPYSDYLISHIKGAISLPFYDVEKRLEELPRDMWIITYCGCPHAISGQALDIIRAHGFKKSGVLDEGVYVWGDLGYPMAGK